MRLRRVSLAVIALLLSLFAVSDFPSVVHAAELRTEKLVDSGAPVKLRRQSLLGIEVAAQGVFALRSAEPGTVDEFGSHYISIAMLADVVLAPGDFDINLKLGLVKLSKQPGPVMFSVKIGTHWYEFAIEDNKVTVKGIRLDTVRRIDIEMTHTTNVSLDGSPFTLAFKCENGIVRVLLNDRLLQEVWIEPTGGDLAICVERESLLRVASSAENTEAEARIYNWSATAQFEQVTAARKRWESLTGDGWRLMKRVGKAYEYQADDTQLPNVLLIGDSISIYYTDTVRRLLAGHADVYRTPMGPGKAETLFGSLDDFLEQGEWNVIHFNTGLHDFVRKEGTEKDLQEYRENLRTIIGKLQATGAHLIWGSTTPVPEKAPVTVTSDALCQKYNAAAANLMEEVGIPVNDLYTAIRPSHSKYWTAPNNIHFNEAGSAFLGRRVANAILPCLSIDEAK